MPSDFTWHRSHKFDTRDEADNLVKDLQAKGVACHREDWHASIAIGLPETFSPDFPTVEHWS